MLKRIRLNGWLRIGIVLSVLWVLGVACYMWNNIINEADGIAKLELDTCFKQNPQHSLDSCSNVWLNAFQHSKEESLKEWWIDYPLTVFIPPFLGFLIWLFSYGLVRLFYWIRAGFGTKNPAGILKKSFILTGSFIGVIAAIAIIVNVQKRFIDKAYDECNFGYVKANFDAYDYDKYGRYMSACMEAKGYLEKGCSWGGSVSCYY